MDWHNICPYCSGSRASLQSLEGHIPRCSQNPAAKRPRTDLHPPYGSPRHSRSRRRNHNTEHKQECQDEIATNNNQGAAEEQNGAPIDEAEEQYDEAEQEQLQVGADISAEKGVVLKYKNTQEHNNLVRRLSELSVFTPEQRDEMKLLQLSITYNWTQDSFNAIVDWAKDRVSDSNLRKYKSLTKEIVEGYRDEAVTDEIRVANRSSSIQEISNDEEEIAPTEQPTSIITRDIVCNDILTVCLELFDRFQPELQRYEEGSILQSLNQGDWWKEMELCFCYDEGTLVPDKFLFPIIPFADGVLAANGGKLSVGAILATLGFFSVEELSRDGYREYVASLDKGTISEAEKINLTDVDLDIFHRSLEVIFKPIRECAEQGGFSYIVKGVNVTFVPVIPFIVQDTDEGNRLCGVFNSWSCEQPCRICEVSKRDCDNPNC